MKNNTLALVLNPVETAANEAPDDAGGAASARWGFLADLLTGLARPQKSISPKYFYDAAGSALFERICHVPEYYPTRTELGILRAYAQDMAAHMGPHAEVVEFGAGSLHKVRLLLDAMDRPRRYIPIDICGDHLHAAAHSLRQAYPALDVHPHIADFTQDLALPPHAPGQGRRVGLFTGSTLGNFDPCEALRFLRQCARVLAGGALLLGVDLVKNPDVLHAAYNDAEGVTAAFNRNILARANRELGADFCLHQFAHSAFYNAAHQRIEMHLMSTCAQTVRLGDSEHAFAEGETLHTENSYKFTVDGLHQLARQAGFTPGPVWTDPERQFCLLWLDASGHSTHPYAQVV
jgi:dimethylhistidine N-methyltransferase